MKRVLVLLFGCEAFSWQEEAPVAGSLSVGFCREGVGFGTAL